MQHAHTYLPQFFCIFCASLLLVGCSYFDTGEHESLQTEKPEMVEVDVKPQPVDLPSVISANTQGSVQIFDFDSPAPGARSIVTPSPEPQARVVEPAPAVPVTPIPSSNISVFSADPSVQIFPLDDIVPADLAPIAAPAQPMRKEEFVAVNAANGDRVIVYFNHDSATLTQEAQAQLDGVASSFNTAARGITIEGHASIRANYNDAAQRKIVNLKVSMNRAFAVAAALIQRGVPADAIRVMAWGDAQPPRDLNGKTADEAARRVEISG